MRISKRFSAMIAVLAVALSISSQTFAQDLAVRWSAYLFSTNNQALVRVFQDGAQTTYSLGLEPETYVGGYDLAFTANGEKTAFCVVKFPAEGGAQGATTFYVRDIEPQTTSLQLDLGKAIGCRTGHHAYNPDGTQVVIARVNYYPGDPAADATLPSWQLTLIDTTSGAAVQEINSQTPAALSAGIPADQPLLPYVQYVADNQVIFAAVPYGIGGGGEFPAYSWLLDTGTITPIDRWGNINLDTLAATGELIWVAADPNRPAGNPGGPMPSNNELKLADMDGKESIIYYSPDWVLTDAQFINGGQQIAIQEVSSFDEGNPDQPQITKWIALDRSGTVSDLQNVTFYSSLTAAPQGYAVLDTQFLGENQTNPRYTFDWHSNGGTTTLWSFDAPDFSYSWELVWSAYTQPAPNLQPFPAFTG